MPGPIGSEERGARSVASNVTFVTGPAGPIEIEIDVTDMPSRHVAVVCHPHPAHGGSMHNKVATTISRELARAGAKSLRFNFRGVGQSAGAYDEGRGELQDALAVIDWASNEHGSDHDLILAGFSFGAAIAFQAALQRSPSALLLVAPAVQRVPRNAANPRCPWLVVYADDDGLVSPDAMRQWTEGFEPMPTVEILQRAGHFFHGRLLELREVVACFLAANGIAAC